MPDEKIHNYKGHEVDVDWDERLCIHISECGRAANDLFVGGRKPWCQPDRVSVDEVVDVIERCPSGALTYTRKDDGPSETAPAENVVTVVYNGPLFVRGDLRIDGAAEDMSGVRFRAALCRCGKSENKPFCDNSHETVGFKDYGAVGEAGASVEAQGGILEVSRVPNGPLLLSGNFTIVASSGRLAWSGNRAALCRCGESRNKPFCDGSHNKAGFQAE